MRNLFFIYIIQILFCTIVLKGQDSTTIFYYPPADLVDVNVEAYVNYNNLSYHYTLFSNQSSQQRVWAFSIENTVELDSILSPNNWKGISFPNTEYISYWSSDSTTDIYPGNSLSDLSIHANGIPSIITYYVQGYIDIPVLNFEPDSVVGGNFYENSKTGKTIGPNDPPEEFFPADFADTLVSYTSQSYDLGWMSDEKTRDKYLDSFYSIKSYIEEEDFENAIKALENVMEMAEEDLEAGQPLLGGIPAVGTITTEAFALIYYNSEYLIKKLEEQKMKN